MTSLQRRFSVSPDSDASRHNSSLLFTLHWNVSCIENPDDMVNPWRINEFFVPIIITYSVTFVLGVLGNVMAMFGMIGDRKSRNVTNSFLVSLSAADLLLLLVCVPLETLQYFVIRWDEAGTVCKMAKYVEVLSAVASVLNLTAVSLERFIVIVFPMRSRSLCTLSNCRRAVLAVWLISMILTAPVIASKDSNAMIFTNGVDYVTVYYCNDRGDGLIFSIYQGIVLLLAPGIVMIVCYTYVIRELWISTKNMNALTNSTNQSRYEGRFMAEGSSRWSSYKSWATSSTTSGSRGHGACLTPCHGPCSANSHSAACKSPLHHHQQTQTQQKQHPSLGATRSVASASSTRSSSQWSRDQQSSPSLRITRNARRNNRLGKSGDARKARKQVIKMLILVIFLFLICWGPRILMEICIKLELVDFSPAVYTARIVLYLLPFIHSCVNPIIYSLMSKNFRRSMARHWSSVCCCCCFSDDTTRQSSCRPRLSSTSHSSTCCNYNGSFPMHHTSPAAGVQNRPDSAGVFRAPGKTTLRTSLLYQRSCSLRGNYATTHTAAESLEALSSL